MQVADLSKYKNECQIFGLADLLVCQIKPDPAVRRKNVNIDLDTMTTHCSNVLWRNDATYQDQECIYINFGYVRNISSAIGTRNESTKMREFM